MVIARLKANPDRNPTSFYFICEKCYREVFFSKNDGFFDFYWCIYCGYKNRMEK